MEMVFIFKASLKFKCPFRFHNELNHSDQTEMYIENRYLHRNLHRNAANRDS